METVQSDSQLVVQKGPARMVSEKVLDFASNTFEFIGGSAGVLLAITIFGSIGQLVATRPVATYTDDYSPAPLVPWAVVAAILVACIVGAVVGFGAAFLFRWMSHHFYEEVLQGKIVTVKMTVGGDYPVFHEVMIKGYNRMKELRTESHDVEDETPTRNYTPGEYVDFS